MAIIAITATVGMQSKFFWGIFRQGAHVTATNQNSFNFLKVNSYVRVKYIRAFVWSEARNILNSPVF